MLRVLYSYDKSGDEDLYWRHNIEISSSKLVHFTPFNHSSICPRSCYSTAFDLDSSYRLGSPSLTALYNLLVSKIHDLSIDLLYVDHSFPYHPEFLASLPCVKALRICDGWLTAYKTFIPLGFAYDHIFYNSPYFSPTYSTSSLLSKLGIQSFSLQPLGHLKHIGEPIILKDYTERDIDIVFVGSLHREKMQMLADVSRYYGQQFSIYGMSTIKQKLAFFFLFNGRRVIRSLPFMQIPFVYNRSRIGINIHNNGYLAYGNARFFDLPFYGVVQVCESPPDNDLFPPYSSLVHAYTDSHSLIKCVNKLMDDPVLAHSISSRSPKAIQPYTFQTLLHSAILDISHLC
ncbi:glycosyltransferase [Synechococcus sp. NB0720_010]|uniref:glycosyltransferase family protein n=1 Tax=Synechococcus sp. NB0720_010 TaxID=2907159 RepID=UPI001FF7A6F5|nr:glycosyltransferase [Synechococcus sp. NB0720_010]UPH89126.1 glycosyltransferase [Synechococcus sp. NB0720_010]